jgi:hypothetical protein
LPTTLPSYTASKINTGSPGSGSTNSDYAESTFLTFSGLLPGFSYDFTTKVITTANPTEAQWTAASSTDTFNTPSSWDAGDYIDDGGFAYSVITSTGASDGTTYSNYAVRVYVTINFNTGTGFYSGTYALAQPSTTTLATGNPAIAP